MILGVTVADVHPLDGALGDIHEIALLLAYREGQYYELAMKLAAAHEAIQQYLVNEMK